MMEKHTKSDFLPDPSIPSLSISFDSVVVVVLVVRSPVGAAVGNRRKFTLVRVAVAAVASAVVVIVA
jgi:hypothetical protein